MPMEIEHHTRRGLPRQSGGGLAGTSWTTTRVAPTMNAPFAGVDLSAVQAKLPEGKTLGVKVGMVGQAPGRAPTLNELNALFLPVIRSHQFEVVGTPKYVLDDNPVWTWKYDAPNNVWEAVIASGPFAGQTGSVLALNQNERPTLKDTLDNPKGLFSYSVVLRPTNLEMPEGKAGILMKAIRDARRPYSNLGISFSSKYSIVPVAAPKNPEKKGALATAALIGIGISLLSWGAGS